MPAAVRRVWRQRAGWDGRVGRWLGGAVRPSNTEAEGRACPALAMTTNPAPWSRSPPGAAMSVQVAAPGGVGLGPERPSPEELVRQTRQVVKGLEALRAEHRGLAGHLAEALAAQGPAAGLELLEEKQQVVSHSLEAIELGLGEAQVGVRGVLSAAVWLRPRGSPGGRGQECWGMVLAKGGLGAPGPGQGASSPEMGSLACSCGGFLPCDRDP